MKIDIGSFCRLTIRARCAFVLFVADSVARELSGFPELQELSDASVRMAAQWVQGLHVEPDALNRLLLDVNDEGLFAHIDTRYPKASDRALTVVSGAICYVAWHAYAVAGQVMPEGIEDASEDYVQWVIDSAVPSPRFDEAKSWKFLETMQGRHSVDKEGELGSPIGFDEIAL